jgi:lysophospholipase II
MAPSLLSLLPLLCLAMASAVRTASLKVGNGGLVVSAAFAKHSATVILMHGLGDSAEGLEDLALMWRNQFPHIKFILPTAPTRPVTLNMGQRMNAWYNINSLDDRQKDPCEGLEDSASFIHSLVESEKSLGLPRSRIMLAGFSQGGALSLFSGLQVPDATAASVPEPLAGILVLSGYLQKSHIFNLHDGYKSVPVFHCHGDADPVVSMHKEYFPDIYI